MAILPPQIQAGTTLALKATVSLYPAPAYSLEIALVSQSARRVITSTDNGDGRHALDATAAATALWPAGRYDYQITAVSDDLRFHVEKGSVEILPSFAAAAAAGGLDTRSTARKIVDACNAILMGVADDAAKRIKVRDRELESYDLADLVKLRNQMLTEVRREESDAGGLDRGQPIRLRFGARR